MLREIESALEAEDPAELRRAAHAMKGALNHLGANGIADEAHKLELMGQTGELDNPAPLFDQLRNRVEQLTTELEVFTNSFGSPNN